MLCAPAVFFFLVFSFWRVERKRAEESLSRSLVLLHPAVSSIVCLVVESGQIGVNQKNLKKSPAADAKITS